MASNVFGSYHMGVRQIVAYSCEAQVCQAAADQCDYFVKAVENARNDCGLYIGPETLERDQGLAHIYNQLHQFTQRDKIIAPFEIKSLTPANDFRKSGIWRWTFRPDQVLSCQVVIFATPKDPDFIAFLPMHYLSSLRSTKIKNEVLVSLPKFRPQWTLHPLPAFPPELVPFLVPVSQLGVACGNTRDYIKGTDVWRNAYTGVVFALAPRPELFDMSILRPRSHSQQTGLDEFWRTFEIFKTHSQRFRVEFVSVSPFLGDMRLIDKITGEEVFVELKLGHCGLVRREHSRLNVLWHLQAACGQKRPIFSWKAQWDYIFTVTSTRQTGYFLPRDDIPTSWWNASCFVGKPKAPRRLEMSKGFQEFAIDLHSGLQSVQHMERILSTRQSKTGSMRARTVIPITQPSYQIGEEDAEDEEGEESEEDAEDEEGEEGEEGVEGEEGEEEREGGREPEVKQGWATSGYRRGFGSTAHPELRGTTYDAWVSEVLTERCRASGRGLVLDFGEHNTICRFAIARYNWSEDDKLRYDQDGDPPCRVWHLPNMTPVVPLSFLRFDWTGNWHPCGTRQSETQAKNILARPRSFVVCDMYPNSCLRVEHARFVCASEHVQPRLLRTQRKLVTKGIIDQFHVDSDDLIDALLAPLCGQSEITVGLGGQKVQAADYCHIIKEIHQAGVDGVREAMHWNGKPGKKARKKTGQ